MPKTTFKELLEIIEKDDGILKFKHPSGVHLWPILRHTFYQRYFNEINQFDSAIPVTRLSKWKILKTILIRFKKNPLAINRHKIDFIFFCSGVTNILDQTGKFFNRVNDHFFYVYPRQSILIEDSYLQMVSIPRVHAKVRYPVLFEVWIKLCYTFNVKKSPDAVLQLLRLLEIIVPDRLSSKFWFDIQQVFLTRYKRIEASYNLYSYYLKRINPKLIFIEDASYGYKTELILAAKKLNISVASYQCFIV